MSVELHFFIDKLRKLVPPVAVGAGVDHKL